MICLGFRPRIDQDLLQTAWKRMVFTIQASRFAAGQDASFDWRIGLMSASWASQLAKIADESGSLIDPLTQHFMPRIFKIYTP